MTNEYTHNTTDLIRNLERMTHDELKATFNAIYDMYVKFDDTDMNHAAEHFRTQIDMIENYANQVRSITMFDLSDFKPK